MLKSVKKRYSCITEILELDELEDGHANRTINKMLYHISYGG